MPHTSKHISTHFKYLTSIEALIEYLNDGGDVTAKDDKNNTLLHVTIFYNKTEDRNGPIIQYLLEKGADVHSENLFYETPLYLAIWHSNDVAVTLLLDAGADLIFKRENALHLAAEIGYVKNVELLLASPKCNKEIVNGLDDDGYSPAFRAALTSHKFSLKKLALAGADLSFKTKDRTIMEVMFVEIARPEDWIFDLLDQCITCVVDSQKHTYVVDLSVMAPETNERQLEILLDIIGAANFEEENVILIHPLIEFILILKWNKLSYFYYYIVVVYFMFALSLSFYGFSLNRLSGGGCIDCKNEFFYYGINIFRYTAVFSGFLICCHVILQCTLNYSHFLKFENVCTTVTLIVAISVAVIDDNGDHLKTADQPDWILQVISVLLLVVWMELMLVIGRLPALGYYAIMFTTVLKNVLKVLSIFICLLLGFALSFSIQFHKSSQFSNPWKALVKTTVMMAGEYEYSELYEGIKDDAQFSLVLSRFLFLMFIVLNSIVLMNLMIALAASDIQSLRMQSHARKMKKQAYFMYHMEKVLLIKQLTASYVPNLIRRFFNSRRIRTRYEFNKTMRRSKKIPSKLIEQIKKIAKEHKKTKNP